MEWLTAGIDALARADAAELEALVAAASESSGAVIFVDSPLARERLRAFRHLLMLTRHNLRLLRSTRAAGYGSPRG